MNSIEFDVDVMDTVLSRHEPHGVLISVDVLDEAVISLAQWRYNLKNKKNCKTNKINQL